jgi:hypothetical protein
MSLVKRQLKLQGNGNRTMRFRHNDITNHYFWDGTRFSSGSIKEPNEFHLGPKEPKYIKIKCFQNLNPILRIQSACLFIEVVPTQQSLDISHFYTSFWYVMVHQPIPCHFGIRSIPLRTQIKRAWSHSLFCLVKNLCLSLHYSYFVVSF